MSIVLPEKVVEMETLTGSRTVAKLRRFVSRRFGLIAFATLVAAMAAMPLQSYWFTQANYIGIAALAALGLTLLTGVAGLTSFGQAAFVGISAYASAALIVTWNVSPWVALAAAVSVTLCAAFLIGLITLRLSGHYLPLATIAWALSLYYLFGNIEGLGKSDGIMGVPALKIGTFAFDTAKSIFILIWTFVGVAIAVALNLLDSRPGRAIRALNGGGSMAESCGINTERYKMVAFLMAAMFAAMAGWLYAILQRGVNPTPFHLNAGIEFLFMTVIGGAGHVWGAVVGAIALTEMKDGLQRILPGLLGRTGNAEIIVFGALLILLLQRAPKGLWPAMEKPFRGMLKRMAQPAPTTEGGHTPLPRRTMPTAGSLILDVRKIRKNFGGLVAVNDLSFQVKAGELVALIGPNGAGKSTSFNLISRTLELSSGEIEFNPEGNGRPHLIGGVDARTVARRGLARTFQHVKLLPGMTVLDSVLIGAYTRGSAETIRSILQMNSAEEASLREEALYQLDRVGLGAHAHAEATSLALGQQRIVEIARALCCDPVLLLLDEPAAGLRHLEKQALASLLRQLREQGVTVLIVEHDMDFVMGLVDRIVVMEFGILLAQGTPDEIQGNRAVIEAYLGAES
jgi:branched-chain amino acid transport system permease protein